MLQRIKNHFVDVSFEVVIAVKGGFAVLQIIGAFLVLYVTPNILRRVVMFFTREELTEDPGDDVASYLMHLANSVSVKAQIFAFLYLAIHGILKLILVVALFKKQLWAYTASIVVFSLFVVYELYRYFAHTHSPWLIVLSVFDIAVIWLIWKESVLVKERLRGEIV